MSDLVFKDPPPADQHSNRGKGRWQLFATQLQEHPGKWAVALEGVKWGSTASAYDRLKKAGCEVTRRRNEDQTYDVYARYVNGAK